MSIILQRGDRIHMAVPDGAHGQLIDDINRSYAERNIFIEMIDFCPGLTHPVIVAVFRDPPKPTPMDIMAVMPPGPRPR